MKQLHWEQKLLEERSKELELKEKQLEDQSRLVKQKQYTHIIPSHAESKQLEEVPAESLKIFSSSDLSFIETRDEKDLIHSLINKMHHLAAARFVCTFGLLDKFRPPTLLRGCLGRNRIITKQEGTTIFEQKLCFQNDTIDKRVDALRNKTEKSCTASASSSRGEREQKSEEKRICITAPIPAS
ncbi:hypothetical protein RJ639_043554 [Escallonia herrerae]|uniref:FRIGIDA-like protein n=1 Tax=Escallonia herrerae TaxID=1293975 RepID=A0AA88WBS2_9ASTE|nr:hypothetical protein RJ639_043554 [Escallonia herrerae]